MIEALQWAFILVLCICCWVLDDRLHKLKASYTSLLEAYLAIRFEGTKKHSA